MLSVVAVVGSSSSGGANVTTPPARKRVKAESGGTPTQPVVAAHSPPSNWPQVLQGIQQMRLPGGAAAGAAVDSMGCDRCHEETVEPPEMRFQVLPSHTSLVGGLSRCGCHSARCRPQGDVQQALAGLLGAVRAHGLGGRVWRGSSAKATAV